MNARVLDRHGSLCRQQREEIDGRWVEEIELFRLQVEHTDHLVADHERNRHLGAGSLRLLEVTRVLANVRGVNRLSQPGGGAGEPFFERNKTARLGLAVAQVSADQKILPGLIQQQDSSALQGKMIADDGEDLA